MRGTKDLVGDSIVSHYCKRGSAYYIRGDNDAILVYSFVFFFTLTLIMLVRRNAAFSRSVE